MSGRADASVPSTRAFKAFATSGWRLSRLENGLRIFEQDVDEEREEVSERNDDGTSADGPEEDGVGTPTATSASDINTPGCKGVGLIFAQPSVIFNLLMDLGASRAQWDLTFERGEIVRRVGKYSRYRADHAAGRARATEAKTRSASAEPGASTATGRSPSRLPPSPISPPARRPSRRKCSAAGSSHRSAPRAWTRPRRAPASGPARAWSPVRRRCNAGAGWSGSADRRGARLCRCARCARKSRACASCASTPPTPS